MDALGCADHNPPPLPVGKQGDKDDETKGGG